MEIETEFWVDEKLTDSTSVVLRTDAFADNEKMETTVEEYSTEQIHLGTGWPICWYSTRETVVSTVEGKKETVIEKSVRIKRD